MWPNLQNNPKHHIWTNAGHKASNRDEVILENASVTHKAEIPMFLSNQKIWEQVYATKR